jgi:hypothetical protein
MVRRIFKVAVTATSFAQAHATLDLIHDPKTATATPGRIAAADQPEGLTEVDKTENSLPEGAIQRAITPEARHAAIRRRVTELGARAEWAAMIAEAVVTKTSGEGS